MNRKFALVMMIGGMLISACTVPMGGRTGGDRPGDSAGILKEGFPTPTPLPPLPTREVASKQSVAADGALALSSPAISVAFETSGKVVAVNVQPGQKVKTGDVLAQLDEQTLKDTLGQAQEQLNLTEAQIRNTAAGSAIRPADVASARAALASSQARYTETLRGATKAEYDAARANLVAAQARYSDTVRGASTADLDQARASLAAAQARYNDTLRGASSADLEQARASLDGAKLRLQQAQTGGTASEQEQALRAWNGAKNSLWSAQVSRDQSCSRGTDAPVCKTSEAQVGSAFESERSAYDRYQQTLKPASADKLKASESEVASAQSRLDTLLKANSTDKVKASEAEVASAQSRLDNLLKANGLDKVKAAEAEVANAQARINALYLQSSPEKLTIARSDIASAEARLKQLTDPQPQTDETLALAKVQQSNAKSAVERAERNLSKAKLIAPCDCTVQDVNVAVGSNPTGAALTLLDVKNVLFKTSNLSERDLGSIKAGTAASVRLKPFDKTFNGKVTSILPQSSGVQGSTAIFTVFIALDPAQEELLPGMTGQAEIVVK